MEWLNFLIIRVDWQNWLRCWVELGLPENWVPHIHGSSSSFSRPIEKMIAICVGPTLHCQRHWNHNIPVKSLLHPHYITINSLLHYIPILGKPERIEGETGGWKVWPCSACGGTGVQTSGQLYIVDDPHYPFLGAWYKNGDLLVGNHKPSILSTWYHINHPYHPSGNSWCWRWQAWTPSTSRH